LDTRLERYRVFDAVAKEKSFSAAARALYISQPAVSQSIAQLEAAFDTKLFVRHGRSIELTAEGEVLYGYVRSALGLLQSGEEQLLKINSLSAGELRIGAGDTMTRWYLMPAIERFHRLYPDVSIRITNRTSPETIRLLQDGRLDIGFVNLPIAADGVLFEECLPIHDIFIAGEGYKKLKGRRLSLKELSSYPLVMLERTANSRRWVDRHFLGHGVALDPEIELGSHHLLLDFAEIDLGIACVVREFSAHALSSRKVFELAVEPPIPVRSVGACYHDGIALSPAARTFIDMVKETKI